jgi:hypothetical protein
LPITVAVLNLVRGTLAFLAGQALALGVNFQQPTLLPITGRDQQSVTADQGGLPHTWVIARPGMAPESATGGRIMTGDGTGVDRNDLVAAGETAQGRCAVAGRFVAGGPQLPAIGLGIGNQGRAGVATGDDDTILMQQG